jgi:hypothetical protein
MPYRSLIVLLASVLSATLPCTLEAQRGAPSGTFGERLVLSGWAGGYINNGGFSDGPNFYQFDIGSGLFSGGSAFGGSIHYSVNREIQVGVEGLFSSQDYTRFDRLDVTDMNPGTATVKAIMASVRLVGAPGRISFVASGGAGMISWDLDDPIGDETDLALEAGLGLEYRGLARIIPFAEYTWWWAFHEKDDAVVTNTVRQGLFRGGLRLVVF